MISVADWEKRSSYTFFPCMHTPVKCDFTSLPVKRWDHCFTSLNLGLPCTLLGRMLRKGPHENSPSVGSLGPPSGKAWTGPWGWETMWRERPPSITGASPRPVSEVPEISMPNSCNCEWGRQNQLTQLNTDQTAGPQNCEQKTWLCVKPWIWSSLSRAVVKILGNKILNLVQPSFHMLHFTFLNQDEERTSCA